MSYIKIPEEVEFSENLSPMAKLLFGRIWSLSQKEGYCWATNQHFADLYKVKVWSISNWISELNKEGFIWIEGQGKIRKMSVLTDVKKHKDICENSQANHVKIHTKPCENSQADMNKIKKNNKEEEKEKEIPQNSLSLSFDFFKTVSGSFFITGCTKKEPTKYKRNFAALANIALGLSDSPVLSEKTILQYNAGENEINAINGEIKALQGSLDYFEKVREKAVKNSKDGYIPRLIEKIIINEEYKQPQTVPANAKRDLELPKSELLRIGLSQSDIDEMMSYKVRSFEAAKSVFILAFRAGRVQGTTENLDLFTRCIKQLRPTL